MLSLLFFNLVVTPYLIQKIQSKLFLLAKFKITNNFNQKILPNVSILLIGPSDMGVKVGTEYVTHPQLENLRDAIKRCAFDTDSAFWDMYEVMGGKTL